MMETTEPREREHRATCAWVIHHHTASRSFLAEPKMRSVLVVIANVFVHQAFQMSLIHDDHVIKQIEAAGADPAFRDAVLPRTTEAGSLGLNAEAPYRANNFLVEIAAAIKDQIFWCGVVRECFPQLLNDPGARRMPGHVEVKNAATIMGNDEEAVEDTEDERGHGEEIHGSNGFAMVAQESRPSLCRLGIPRRLSHPSQHRSLRNVEAKHLQFAMNARCAPGRVLGDQMEDEFAQFLADALSSYAGSMPRKPRPIQLESRPMPTDNCARLYDEKGLLPSRPDPAQDDPKEPVRSREPGQRMLGSQNRELLPQCQVFQEEVTARADRPNEENEQKPQQAGHARFISRKALWKICANRGWRLGQRQCCRQSFRFKQVQFLCPLYRQLNDEPWLALLGLEVRQSSSFKMNPFHLEVDVFVIVGFRIELKSHAGCIVGFVSD